MRSGKHWLFLITATSEVMTPKSAPLCRVDYFELTWATVRSIVDKKTADRTVWNLTVSQAANVLVVVMVTARCS